MHRVSRIRSKQYVRKTVDHYRGRITWWQVFKRAALHVLFPPAVVGYTGADYARWSKCFTDRAERQPGLQDPGGDRRNSRRSDCPGLDRVPGRGGLADVDAVDIHHYPRIRPPEFMEETTPQIQYLDGRARRSQPIWMTEYGYYADDNPSMVPMPNSGFR